MPFIWVGSTDGSEPIIKTFPVKDTVVLSKGELVNLESGEADAAATGDTALLGIATHAVDNTNDGETVAVIVNPGAIYADESDTNIRLAGATLDIASGGLGVTTSSNADLLVWENSTATEKTKVVFNGSHYTQV